MLSHVVHHTHRKFNKTSYLSTINRAKYYHNEHHKKYDRPPQLSSSELRMVFEGFRKSDLGRDYLLNKNEFNYFSRYYTGTSISNIELEKLFEIVDINKIGKVNLDAMIKHLEKKFSAQSRVNLEYVFSLHDKDQDGYMSLHELRKAFFYLGFSGGDPNLKKLFEKYDNDNDNRITYTQFIELIKNESATLK